MPSGRSKIRGSIRRGGEGMEPAAYGFLEEMIMRRTNRILHGDLKGTRIFYKEQEAIMKGLDRGTKDRFERFVSNILCISAEEYVATYRGTFLDELCLGYKAFR